MEGRAMAAQCYVQTWRNKRLTADAKSLDDMIGSLQQAVADLQAMKAAGVTLDQTDGLADDYAPLVLVTDDPAVAERLGFISGYGGVIP
jgi:hypothetical protein